MSDYKEMYLRLFRACEKAMDIIIRLSVSARSCT